MIGEFGALGGGLVPNAMGLSKQWTGTYMGGFVLFAGLAVIVLVMMRRMQLRWTRTWAERGGPAIASAPTHEGFGTRLAALSVEQQLGGSLQRQWRPEGLFAIIRIQWAHLARA